MLISPRILIIILKTVIRAIFINLLKYTFAINVSYPLYRFLDCSFKFYRCDHNSRLFVHVVYRNMYKISIGEF